MAYRAIGQSATFRFGLLAGLALLLAGCASPVALTVLGASSGVAMGTSVDYTMNGIAYKTFTASLPETRAATRTAFRQMGVRLTSDQNSSNGWQIIGAANDRTVEITLESITPKVTRMRVVINNGVIFKDRATEAAFLDQVGDALDRNTTHVAGKPN